MSSKGNVCFSVIIPAYNRASLITKTIESVIGQNYQDFEIIVVDDGSTDNTKEVVNLIKDSRLKYFYVENGERGRARNVGINNAIGNYITFLDSDDLLYPFGLEDTLKVLKEYNFPEFLHMGYEIRTPEGKVLNQVNNRKGILNDPLIKGNSLSCMGVFLCNDIAKRFLFKEERELSGSEDYELWLRLASHYTLHYSNKVIGALIQHDARSVLGVEKERLIKRISLLIEIILDYPPFIKRFGIKQNIFVAHRYLYLSLHLILEGEFKIGITFWWKAVLLRPLLVFHYKTLGIIKNISFKKQL